MEVRDQLHPGETAPGTPWIGGWVGHRAGPDTVVKRNKIPSLPLPGIEQRSPSP